MTPEQEEQLWAALLAIIMIELTFFVLVIVGYYVYESFHLSPEAVYYFQNCNNLTLYPQGCQVQT